jgi:hypothetical protein
VYVLGVAGRVAGLVHLAEVTDGLALFIYETEVVEDAAEALLDRARRVRVEDARVTVKVVRNAKEQKEGEKPPKTAEVQGLAWSTPRLGEPIAVAGRLVGPARGKLAVKLEVTVSGRKIEASGELSLAKAAAAGEGWCTANLRKVHAHLLCDRMYDGLHREDARLAELAALVNISKMHRIVTRGTAMLVLEDDDEYIRRNIPRDVSFLGVGQTLASLQQVLRQGQPKRDESGLIDLSSSEHREAAAWLARVRELIRLGEYAKAATEVGRARRGFALAEGFSPQSLALLHEFLQIRYRAAGHPDDLADLAARDEWLEEEERFEEEELVYLSALPWHQALTYWTPRQRMMSAAATEVRLSDSLPPVDEDTKQRLGKKGEPLKMQDVELAWALIRVGAEAGVRIKPRWGALARAGVKEGTRLAAERKGGTMEQKLHAILSSVKGREPLVYRVHGGEVTVTTASDLANMPVSRVYDLQPMLSRLPVYEEDLFPYPRGHMLWGSPSAGGGIFDDGGSTGGIFEDEGGGGFGGGDFWDDGADGQERGSAGMVGTAEWADDPLANVAHAGVVELSKQGEVTVEDATEKRRRRRRVYLPQYCPFPSEGMLCARLVGLISNSIAPRSWLSRSGKESEYGISVFRNLLSVYHQPRVQHSIHALLRQLAQSARRGRHSDILGPGAAESLFDGEACVSPWVIDLLRRVAAGRLSRFSSVEVKRIGDRTFAKVGGVWFDTSLTDTAAVYVVARDSAAGRAVREAAPKLAECFGLEDPAVIAAGAKLAVGLDESGIFRRDDADVRRLVAALGGKKAPKPSE